MKKTLIIASLALASSAAFASGNAPWTYSGAGGPDEWAKLTPESSACAGKNQSPIDLNGFIKADLKAIQFAYQAGGKEIVNNGHTIQINYAPGSSIKLENVQFELKQFHFHAPSENLIKGKSYPLEGHFVHADKDGNLAVIAVMYKEGAENKALSTLWSVMPKEANEKADLANAFSATKLLPVKRSYYRFSGSLTTPPCSEGVRWMVMKNPVSVSKEQIGAFSQVLHHPNNRPVQATNARTILQ